MSEIIRVKDTYYQIYEKPFRDTFRRELGERKKAEIKEDRVHELRDIPKYIDFFLEPDYINFRQVYKGEFYNLFAPFSFEFKQGKWPTVEMLLKHIFEEHYQFGLDYMWNLLMNPKQILPILVLVSKERKTGKTTYINFLRDMFGQNYVKVDPSALSSSFNASWASKNIITIDETVIEKQQSIEKLKDISTSDDILVNGKYQSHYTVPFYGKIIMNSNSEDRFIRLDEEEIRFWIRKCKPINGKEMVNIGSVLLREIPAFAYYLRHEHKPTYNKPQSRHWFNNEDIKTDALSLVKEESKSDLCKDIIINIQDYFDNNSAETLEFTVLDLKTSWYERETKWSKAYIARVLKTELNLECIHKRYTPQLGSVLDSKVGKVYTVTRTTEIEQEQEIPF